VVRRRFGHQVSVAEREIDKAVAAGPVGEDKVELQLQRILLPVSGVDQKATVMRLADAEKIQRGFAGCKSIATAAKRVPDARLESLGARKPSSVAEPTRSMLLNAKEGDLLPPTVGAEGVELYAVCGKTVVKASEEKRSAAQDELRQREFELLARRHLKDLRQDASIEFR
jgi:peptidyl-prolyl cis-trans isomerase SurA